MPSRVGIGKELPIARKKANTIKKSYRCRDERDIRDKPCGSGSLQHLAAFEAN